MEASTTAPQPLDGAHGHLHVADVVERVEDAEDVDAPGVRLLDELLQDVVGVVPVADDVLPAQQHLEGGVGHLLLQLGDALPGVLLQEAEAGVEGGPAPHLHATSSRSRPSAGRWAACPRCACGWPAGTGARPCSTVSVILTHVEHLTAACSHASWPAGPRACGRSILRASMSLIRVSFGSMMSSR